MKRIVVYERVIDGPHSIGSILEPGQQLAYDEAQGERVTLPIEDRALVGGVDGFMRRDWGTPGVVLEGMRPQRVCPMTMYVEPDYGGGYVHMAVGFRRVVGDWPRGAAWISSWPTATAQFGGGLSAVSGTRIDFERLCADEAPPSPRPGEWEPDRSDSWIVKLRCRLSVQVAGYFSCCLQTAAHGVAINWTAVSQSGAEL